MKYTLKQRSDIGRRIYEGELKYSPVSDPIKNKGMILELDFHLHSYRGLFFSSWCFLCFFKIWLVAFMENKR